MEGKTAPVEVKQSEKQVVVPVTTVTSPTPVNQIDHDMATTVANHLGDAGFKNHPAQHVLSGAEAEAALKRIEDSNSGIEVISEKIGAAGSHLSQIFTDQTKGNDRKYVTDPNKKTGLLTVLKRAFQRKEPNVISNSLAKK